MSLHDTKTISEGAIIPPELAVRAMRDSGYRNTAYALAELIDNSVQAGATSVEVVCTEERRLVKEHASWRMNKIGMLDNGSGMAPEVLRLALQFGNGTHLNDRSGIGRFGMGLPNSSISQCRRLQVWTWQHGPDNAMYTYLDVDEIESGNLYTVPMPVHQPLPLEWRTRSNIVDTHGTLVVWDKFDEHRLSWRSAKSALLNTEMLVGRIYRKFIHDGRLQIRMVAFRNEDSPNFDEYVKISDPLYLIENSSTPEPFNKEPMFQKWGEDDETFCINYHDAQHIVTVRMSWAREETLPEDNSDRGAKPYGKHAAKNRGVSIVRAERELHLDDSWTNSYEPTERWWGLELEFPPALDEVFGVTNDKQNATIFSQMAQFDWHAEAADEKESEREFRERMRSEGDPRSILMPIVSHIRRQIQEVRNKLKAQTKGRRGGQKRPNGPTVEDLASTKFRKRAEQGHKTGYDDVEFKPEDRDSFAEDLKTDKEYASDVAQDIANATLERRRKVVILTKAMDGYAFFNVEHPQGGLTAIVFNTNHPFYDHLMQTLRPEIGDETDADLIDRINRASDTLELLFTAWARYEMEEISQQDKLFDFRQEWGKMARFFMSERED